MKKINVTGLLIVISLVCTVLTASTIAQSYWEWSTSDSATAFVESMTNSENGMLLENFPLTSWTVKVADKDKFNSIITNRYYLRNFVAKRVWNVCKENQTDISKCKAARRFLRKSWVVENDNGHLASYELALVFYKVDSDNWFSYDYALMKIAQYLEANYGTRLLRLFKGFRHEGVLNNGGISIEDLPVIIDTKEQTITIYSATLYD